MSNELQLVLTASPDFIDMALEELRAAAPAAVTSEAAPGVHLVGGAAFDELAAAWRAAPPVFVRHICPVHEVAPLAGHAAADLAALREAAAQPELLRRFAPEAPFSVQARLLVELPYKPFDVNSALAAALAPHLSAPLDVRRPQQALSVVCVDEAPFVGLWTPSALLGVSPVADNLSDWAGGMRRFARETDQVSRAEFKLLEALERFAIDLPPRGVALDLGAAPGGWTRVLRARGQYVTAVDPADLDPRLRADRGVRHLRMSAEEYLAQEPDRFDIIVNDMRMDARDSARLMVDYARLLYPAGLALMTLKLAEQERRAALDEALAILRRGYTVEGVRQLFHNRSEVTVFLRPR